MKKLAIFVSIWLFGCSPAIQVYYDSDKGDDIRKYRTFNWISERREDLNVNSLHDNQFTDRSVKMAVNDLLAIKGYLLTEREADLSIYYHIDTEERSVFLPDPYDYMYGDYFMRPRPDLFMYREGTLHINFVNTKSKKLVWHGWAVVAMEMVNSGPNDTDILFKSAVTKILLNLPDAVTDSVSIFTFR